LTFTFVDYAILHISLFTMQMRITHSLYHHLISRAHIALLIIVSTISDFHFESEHHSDFSPSLTHTKTLRVMNLEGKRSLWYVDSKMHCLQWHIC